MASILCKLIGAIFRIPLTQLLGSEGLGLYQLVYPIFALCLVAVSSGVPVAISKIISREKASGNGENIKKVFKNAMAIMLGLGVIFSILVTAFCVPIAKIQGNGGLYVCYLALFPSILLGAIISCFKGYFQGFEIMKYSAMSQIIEQFFKLIFGLFFAYIFVKKGLIFGVFGVFFGIFLSEFFAFLFLFIVFKAKKIDVKMLNNNENIYTNKQTLKLIFNEAVPITLTSIIIPLSAVVDSLIIIKLLSKSGFETAVSSSLYGLGSGVVSSLINLPSVIAVSISASLMPSLSSSVALKNSEDVAFKSKLAIKIVWYFTLPCMIIFFFLSKEIYAFLYGNLSSELFDQISVVGVMLKLSSFSIIYIALNQILTTILQANNESYFGFFVLLFACTIKIVLTIILVPNPAFNIYGFVVSDVVAFSVASVVNLFKARQKIKLNFSFYEIFFVPLVGIGVMTTCVVLFKTFLTVINSRLLTLVCIASSFVLYLLIVVLLKGFNSKEIKKTKFLNFIKNKKY